MLFVTGKAQNPEISRILNLCADSILANVQELNNYDKDTEIGEIKDLYKLSVWHFAPSLSYDFVRHRPYLTISSSNLISHFINKKQEKRRISAIERKYRAKEEADNIKIQNKILSIEADYQDILLNHKAVSIEIESFKINKKQHENNEIDVEKYLAAQASIIGKVKNHNSSVTELYKNILELSTMCGTEIPVNIKPLYFNLNFIE